MSSDEDLPKFEQFLLQSEGKHVCFKDITSKVYVAKEIKKFRNDEACKNQCLDKIENEMGIKRLEYCRALHAEENALLQISKVGGMSIKGGTIYTTTYPCELCAKKLYQTGIRTVYYTEPYPESISDEVFFKDGVKSIQRVPFEGVKSYSYFRLYKPIYDKKELSLIKAKV